MVRAMAQYSWVPIAATGSRNHVTSKRVKSKKTKQTSARTSSRTIYTALRIAPGVTVSSTDVGGVEKILSLPELSVANGHWVHAGWRLAGVPVSAAILWIPASLIMLLTKRIVKKPASA